MLRCRFCGAQLVGALPSITRRDLIMAAVLRFLSIFFFTVLLFTTAFAAKASTATYQLSIDNQWTEASFPNNYPTNLAHFSWLGGGTHAAGQTFWQFGGLATAGLEEMAETGVTTMFVNEVVQAGGDGLVWQHWFCVPAVTHPSCGSLTETFTVDSAKPNLTLTSMLGPSPDWFVGVSDLALRVNGVWQQQIVVDLVMYDAGTEEGDTPTLNNAATSPFEPIAYVVYDSGSGLYQPSATAQSVGTLTLDLLSVEGQENVVVPMPVLSALGLLVIFAWVVFRFRRMRDMR